MAGTKKTGRRAMKAYTTPTNEYEAKHFLFPPVCGGCFQKRVRTSTHDQVGHLCSACKPKKKKEEASVACDICQFEFDCIARVSIGAWVRCESPDAADIARLLKMEAFNDKANRPALESALAQGGNREILEKTVSKVSAALFQRQNTRQKRKVP